MASKKIREKKYVSIGGPRSEGHERKKKSEADKSKSPCAHRRPAHRTPCAANSAGKLSLQRRRPMAYELQSTVLFSQNKLVISN
jgi:hypothetical protein